MAHAKKCFVIYIHRLTHFRNWVWVPQYKKDIDKLEGLQRGVTETIKGLEHVSYGKRLRQLGLLSQEKAPGDLIHVYKHLIGVGRGEKKTKPGSFQQSSVTGQEVMDTISNVENSI